MSRIVFYRHGGKGVIQFCERDLIGWFRQASGRECYADHDPAKILTKQPEGPNP